MLALGPVPVRGTDQTFQPDQTKGRTGDTSFVVPRPFTIHAEKCPNRRGVVGGPRAFRGEGRRLRRADAARRLPASFRACTSPRTSIDPWIDEAESKALRSKVGFLVVQDTTVTPLAHLADVVLAGATFAEKAGCYVNADGRLQYSEAALPPRDGSLPDLDLLAILLDRPGGPVTSSEVLAELAETIPAFAVAKEASCRPTASSWVKRRLESHRPRAPAGFTDAWFVAHGVARWR